MKQDEEKPPEEIKPSKNFESFDLWSQARFALWSNIRFDFELIAELTRYRKSTRLCLEILDTVNKYLKNTSEKVFFDGTIKCLKYLVKNGHLDIAELPLLTQDEKYLVELLQKYHRRLDITDVFSDIEEPTLRAIFLEYPNLIGEVFKDGDPMMGQIVGRALMKNGITDAESFLAKVDNGATSIEVDKDKNSKEAMRCKLIYLGLRLNNGKLKITSSASGLISEFSALTDEVIENETYTKSVFNSIYVAMYGSDLWSEDRRGNVSGCELLYLNFQLLMLPDNHMSLIYNLFLKTEVDKIGIKYFGDRYDPKGFVGSLAIKLVIIIIIFRAENFLPRDEKAEVDLFTAGAMLGTLNYAVEGTGDKENPLKLKKWFLDYFTDELDKRVAFIKLQIENGVGLFEMREVIRVFYIPVFESFRFFCGMRKGLLEQVIILLKNRDIPSDIKDDIFINFVVNIQKIVTDKLNTSSDEEKYFKDTFMLLISQAFEGLGKNILRSFKNSPQVKKFYEDTDLQSDVSLAIIELILRYDMSKNDSFIAYMKSNLRLKLLSICRMNETDKRTDTEGQIDPDGEFWDNIPDTADFIASLDNEKTLTKMRECIEKLPEKEKEAIKKVAEQNERLNDTERKAKNRGLDKIRQMMDV